MLVHAFIPVVNRADLLTRAALSLEPFTAASRRQIGLLTILDNSGNDLASRAVASNTALRFAAETGRLWIVTPIVPLTFAQSQNAIQRLTLDANADVAIIAHSDMIATTDAVERLLSRARADTIVFSHYDVCLAIGAIVMKHVGPWDTAIPWYYADNDWYRRARLANVPIIEVTGEGVTHQNDASSTMKSDWRLAISENMQTKHSQAVYAAKWGGMPDHERYTVAYDGERLSPPLNMLRDHPVYHALEKSYTTHEGTLFEGQSDEMAWAQVKAIAWAYEQAGRPSRVVETGTAKGFFGYLLSVLRGRAGDICPVDLLTFDGDARTIESARILAAQGCLAIRVRHVLGDSRETLPQTDLEGVGMAWIDGGHDEDVALSDLLSVLAAGVPWVLLDDSRLTSVARAWASACQAFPMYRRIAHPWEKDDERGITVLTNEP